MNGTALRKMREDGWYGDHRDLPSGPARRTSDLTDAIADGLTANAIPKGQEVLIVIGEGLEKERIEVRLKGKGGCPEYRCVFR